MHVLLLVIAWLVPSSLAYSVENFLVKDIRVEGLQRIAPGTVFNYLPVKVGDTLTDENAREAIQALFKTGFFEDVRLERNGDVLVVNVVERPSIDSIEIRGAKEIEDKVIKQGLKDVGLAEGRVYNSSLLDKTEQELKRQYFGRGRYGMTVKTTVKPLERNRVSIRIDINEGEVAKIRSISIIGNKLFTDKQLMSTFKLTTPNLFSFITKSDQYSKQQLAADLESLRSFYQNQGYLDFAIESTQVAITPDRQDITVTLSIVEGRRYSVTDVKLAGRLIVPEPELRKLILVQPGDVFSRQAVTESSKSISDRLGNDGYAFANVNPVPDIDREKGTVAFTFFVDPGQRVYVRRINFVGNLSTNDEVLRREMRQMEGAWYSSEKIKRSRERILRLGFFDDVNLETPAVPGTPDQVDIQVTVKERLVNTFSFGIGYSDLDGALINASVNFKNFLGAGNDVQFSADTSKVNKHLNFNFVEPYYTANGISRTLSLYSSTTDASQANAAAYFSDTKGAGITFGIPLSETHTLSIGIGYENVNIEVPATNAAKVAQDFIKNYGDTNSAFKVSLGWARDTLDNPLLPNSGTQHRLSFEASIPGSDLEYYRVSWTSTAYVPLLKYLTFKLKGAFDYGDGYGNTAELPFYKNYYAGGSNSVRGYRARSLGPKDIGGFDETLPIGGDRRILANTELLFPFPGATDNKAMRLSLFVDAGMVYGPGQDTDLGELRYSTGIGFSWYSPIGPLSISYAFPLNDQPGDRTESVQFTLGQPFR